MKSLTIITGILLLSIVSTPLVYAETGLRTHAEVTTTDSHTKAKADVREKNPETKREGIEERKESIKQNVIEKREALKNDVPFRKASTTTWFKEHSDGLKVDFKARFASSSKEMKDTREAFKKKLTEKAKENVETIITRVETHFTQVIERLTNIDAKIEARIAKVAETGVEVSTSTTLLDEARHALAQAKVNLEALPTYLKDELNADEVSRDTLKEAIEVTRESVEQARKAYIKVVTSLKGEGKFEVNAD